LAGRLVLCWLGGWLVLVWRGGGLLCGVGCGVPGLLAGGCVWVLLVWLGACLVWVGVWLVLVVAMVLLVWWVVRVVV